MEIKDIHQSIKTNWGWMLEKFRPTWEKQIEGLKSSYSDSIEAIHTPWSEPVDVPVVFVKKSNILRVLNHLKSAPGFEYEFLADLTATDEMPDTQRFHIVYNLYSPKNGWRIRVKAKVTEGEKIDSAISVWQGANWAEREVFDMFGVQFDGHPDLRRILMDLRWKGHPLRKDYPLRGYQVFPTPEPIDPKLLEGDGA
jgi:NADH-quinone oxidoreductase subunit C